MNNRIKYATDVEQSKKLCEFIDVQSSDMYWEVSESRNFLKYKNTPKSDGKNKCIHAWSLPALINLLPWELCQVTDANVDIEDAVCEKYTMRIMCERGDPYRSYKVLFANREGAVLFSRIGMTPIDAVYYAICGLRAEYNWKF